MKVNPNPNSKKRIRFLTLMSIGTLAWFNFFMVSSCGKQAFKVSDEVETVKAGGTFVLPPRVDLILAQDDTGSMAQSYDEINQQTRQFLADLESENWDFHFTSVPLTKTRTIEEVEIVTSKHDGNWDRQGRNQWKEPFPGADPNDPTLTIPARFFVEPDFYSGFLSFSGITSTLNAHEPGLENILSNLKIHRDHKTGFIRPALLAVVVVSNGNDTSGINFCKRGYPHGTLEDWIAAGRPPVQDGWEGPCEQIYPSLGSGESSLQDLKNEFLSLKDATPTNLIRFYSAVAFNREENCRGARSRVGERYMRMSSMLGGESYDICSQSISSVLSSVAKNLKSIVLKAKTPFVVIPEEPNLSTVKIYKVSGSQKTLIPRDEDRLNGWSYDSGDNPRTVFTTTFPTNLNPQTGYVFELHGNAILEGNQSYEIEYTPAGIKDSF